MLREEIAVSASMAMPLGCEFRDKHKYNYELDFYITNCHENVETCLSHALGRRPVTSPPVRWRGVFFRLTSVFWPSAPWLYSRVEISRTFPPALAL